MEKKIEEVVWPAKVLSSSLFQSIENFKEHAKKANRPIRSFIYHSENESRETHDLVIRGTSWKKNWYKRWQASFKAHGIDPSLVAFALLGPEHSHQCVRTGTNRNVGILCHQNELYLSVDEDAFICGLGNPEDSPRHSAEFPSFTLKYFADENAQTKFLNTYKTSKLDFFKVHEKSLVKKSESVREVAISVSGIFGDSGWATPKMLFSLDEGQLQALLSEPGLIDRALTNRLIYRQVENTVATPFPLVMTTCAALNNTLILPPFFPIGRNQDGAYGYLIKACLPGALISQAAISVHHIPETIRNYPSASMNDLRLRINDLLILLLGDYLNQFKQSTCPYESVGDFLLNFARLTSKNFLEKTHALYAASLKARYERITKNIETVSRLKLLEGNRWIQLAENEITMTEKASLDYTNFLPIESVMNSNGEMHAIETTRIWLGQFGELLRAWPVIRKIVEIQ